MELPRVPARVFDCTVSEFLQSRADADPSEGEAIAAILQSKGITAPRKLGLLTVEQLALGADVPAGYVATITEALQKAAFYKRALQRAEEGEDTVPAIASSASGASLFAARTRMAHPHLLCASPRPPPRAISRLAPREPMVQVINSRSWFSCSPKATSASKRVHLSPHRRQPSTRSPSPNR